MAFLPLYNIAKIQDTTDSPKFGKVIDVNDPKKKRRIKVSLEGVFEPTDEKGSNLPWVRQLNDTFLNSKDNEAYSVPAIGSIVEVVWLYDQQTPFYRGCPTNDTCTTGKFTTPLQWGWADQNGFLFRIDKETNQFTLQTKGFELNADTEGNYFLKTATTLVNVTKEGNTSIKCKNMQIDCEGFTLNSSSTINLNGSSGTNIKDNSKVYIKSATNTTTIDDIVFLTHKHWHSWTRDAGAGLTEGVVA